MSERKEDEELVKQGSPPSGSLQSEEQLADVEELRQTEEHRDHAGNSDSTHSYEANKNVDSAAEEAKLNGDVILSPKPTVDSISNADDFEGGCYAMVDEGNATEIQAEIVAGTSKAEEFYLMKEHENPAGSSDSTHLDEVEKNVDSADEEAKLNRDDNFSPKPIIDRISNADDVEGDVKEAVDEGNATEIHPELVAGASKENLFCQTEEHENPAENSDSTHSDEVDKNVDSAAEEAKLNRDANLFPKPTVDGISSGDNVEGDCKAMVDENNATKIHSGIVVGTSEAEELHQMGKHENPAGNSDSTDSDEVEKNVDSAAEEAKLNGDVILSPKHTVDGVSSGDDVERDSKATVNEGNATEIHPDIVAGVSKEEEFSQTEELENSSRNFDSTHLDEGDKNVDLEAEEAKLNGDVKLFPKPTVDGISSADDVEGDCKAIVDEGNATKIPAEIVAGASKALELHQMKEHENHAGNSDSTHSDEGDKNVDSAAKEAKLNADVNLSPKPTVDGISSADSAERDGKATVDEGNASEIQLEIIVEVSKEVPDAKEEDANNEKSKDMDESNVVEGPKQVEESKDVEESKEVGDWKEVNESKKVEKELKGIENSKNVKQVKNEEKTGAEIHRPVVSYAVQVKEFDQESRLVKEAVSDIDDLKPGIFCGRAHEASYTFTPEKEGVFSVSDLVWGKVKSHPWWPGQIFDSSDASEGALKYRKKDSFLVAYFGDQTFAWNEASSLNHFRTHFSQMEKQSNSDAFCIAVDYALDEFCRRVELSMVCTCTPKETRAKLKSQITENAGIREEVRSRDGPNNSLCVTPFDSGKLLQYIKALAPYPCNEVDRLELKIAQTQLLAFYRLKGYCRLPEFIVYGGLLENEIDSSGHESHSKEVIEHETPDSYNNEEELSDTDKLKSQDRFSHKHGSDEVLYSSRKKRSLSSLMAVKNSPACLVSNGKNGVDERVASSSGSSSGMKRNTVDPFSENSALRFTKRKINAESPTPQSFKVGECFRRIASQLAGSPPILKSSSKVDKGSVYDGFDGSFYISEHFHGRQVNIPEEYSCPDEMLSQLCLAARDPMKGYSFLTTIVGFFSDFRNSISLESSSLGKQKTSEKKIGGGRSGIGIRRPLNIETSSNDTFDFEDLGDSYWTDRIIQSSPEKELSHRNKRKGTELHSSPFEVEDALLLSVREKNLDEDYVPIKEKPSHKYQKKKRKTQVVLPVDETAALDSELFSLDDYEGTTEDSLSRLNENNYVRASYPMALLMSFSELDSIPSEMNLNKIFRRFGPLKESETEVMRDTSSAKVVFKKQADAEVAFSSAAKFSIFGSAHVNYQLRNVWL